jgi:hypothetical protein
MEDNILKIALEAKEQMVNEKVPEVQPEPLDEDEQAAMFLNSAHKDFRRVAFALADRKKHSVSRVLEAVLFEPLEEVKLQGKAEKELFDLCKKIMYAKGKVLTYAYNRIQESKKEQVNE